VRGALLDLLAIGDTDRVSAAIQYYLRLTSRDSTAGDATPGTLLGPTGERGTA
jgi:hypothetical protein